MPIEYNSTRTVTIHIFYVNGLQDKYEGIMFDSMKIEKDCYQFGKINKKNDYTWYRIPLAIIKMVAERIIVTNNV
jgi:hypothetical protein